MLINNKFKKKNKYDKDGIKKFLKDKKFQVSYSKKNYTINDINFDRNPTTQTFPYEGRTVQLVEYYNERYDLDIEDLTQPLIVVKKKDVDLYFIPEFCYFSELDDKLKRDYGFMSKLANYTKLKPDDRVAKTNKFLDLLVDPTKKEDLEEKKDLKKQKDPKKKEDKKKKQDPKENEDQLSAKEKSEKYGIVIKELKESHKGYYMKDTILIDKEKKPIKNINKPFNIVNPRDMSKWLCVYRASNNEKTYKIIYNKALDFSETLINASHGYNITISPPQWLEIDEEDDANAWITKVEEEMENGEYTFVVHLLDYDEDDNLYKDLKIHSLCHNGYVSQIVKFNSLNKNPMSVCSKILLQINSKLSGVSYLV